MARLARITAIVAFMAAVVGGLPLAALAHEEREVTPPGGSAGPPSYRSEGPQLLVCKSNRTAFEKRIAGFPDKLRRRNLELFQRCQDEGYRHLQAAVDDVDGPGTTILVLPGVYHEEPSLEPPRPECAKVRASTGDGDGDGDGAHYQELTYQQQQECPHSQSLVAIMGINDLQIEGTGADPEDVVFDAQFNKLNAIRADRADGLYLRNFTVQRTTFTSIYIVETSGFVIHDMVARWNDENGFFTFAVNQGLYKGCEAYGNGNAGLHVSSIAHPGGGRGSDARRYRVEIRDCRSHHNLVGYSGNGGWVHDSQFYANAVGISIGSASAHHPGPSPGQALFEDNLVHHNNQNYYGYVRDGTCANPSAQRDYADGVVCPAIGVPVGTGVRNAGNGNVFRNNWVYGNNRAGFMQVWVSAFGRSDAPGLFGTSHRNTYVDNRLGVNPAGQRHPNGVDFWWDGQGIANCWQPGHHGATPVALPECGSVLNARHMLSEPAKLAQLYLCHEYSLAETRVPTGCAWYGATGLQRVEVQLALGSSLVLGLLAILLWWRRLRYFLLATAGMACGVGGAVAGVYGALHPATLLPALSVALLGGWWACTGMALRPAYPRMGSFTVVLGVVAVVNALDKGVLVIPLIPVQPAWVQLLLGLVWVLLAVGLLASQPQQDRVNLPIEIHRADFLR